MAKVSQEETSWRGETTPGHHRRTLGIQTEFLVSPQETHGQPWASWSLSPCWAAFHLQCSSWEMMPEGVAEAVDVSACVLLIDEIFYPPSSV